MLLPAAFLRSLTSAALTSAVLAVMSSQAADAGGSLYLLLPASVSESRLTRPGESHEHRFHGERTLPLSRGLQWQTSTDLRRTRYEQVFPAQSQTLNLSTGPRLKLGQVEIAVPFNTLREANALGITDAWRSAAPRMTLALGPNDHIRLEARVSRQDVSSMSRRWTAISWRHHINDHWILHTGLSHALSSAEDYTSSAAEAHAGLDWSKPRGLSWSLTSRLSGSASGTKGSREAPIRTHASSLSLLTRYPLQGGWWLGGELRTSQTYQGGGLQSVRSQSAGVRLFRNF